MKRGPGETLSWRGIRGQRRFPPLPRECRGLLRPGSGLIVTTFSSGGTSSSVDDSPSPQRIIFRHLLGRSDSAQASPIIVRISHRLLLRRRKTRSGRRRASRLDPRRVSDTPPVEPLELLARSRLTPPRDEVGEKWGLGACASIRTSQ